MSSIMICPCVVAAVSYNRFGVRYADTAGFRATAVASAARRGLSSRMSKVDPREATMYASIRGREVSRGTPAKRKGSPAHDVVPSYLLGEKTRGLQGRRVPTPLNLRLIAIKR